MKQKNCCISIRLCSKWYGFVAERRGFINDNKWGTDRNSKIGRV